MLRRYFTFFILLNVMNMCIEATVISQINQKVIVDAVDVPEPRLFYIQEDLGLVQVSSIGSQIVARLQHGESATAVDYHHPRNLLFWTTSTGAIYSCSLRQSRNVRLVHEEKKWRPIALAVDYLDDRLYVIDARTNTLRILDLDGEHPVVLVMGARNYRPTHVELDPREGYIFLLDDNNPRGHLLRMNMDGSKSKIIDPPSLKMESQVGKITVDRINKNILVSSKIQHKIFSIDYNGKILNTILQPQNGVLSMSTTKKELFWVNAVYYSYGTNFVDGSVYKCSYEDGKGCRKDSIRVLYNSYPGNRVIALKVLEPASQNPEAWNNNYGGSQVCEQLRLGDYCACEIGWQLANDLKSCIRIDEFLIYEDNRIIRSVCLKSQQKGRCQAIEPFEAKLQLKNNERTGFIYDSTTRKLYYGGKDSIYRVDIDTVMSTRLLYQKGVFFGPMVLDWITKNLYYTEIEWRGNVTFYVLKVMLVNTDDPKRIQESTSLLWEFGRIHSLAVHPNRGYLFVSAIDNKIKKYRLFRLDMDAKNLTVLSTLDETKFLSLDHLEDKLYVLNANGSTIANSDLYGRGVVNITDTISIRNVTGFLVHDKLIYVKNLTSIHRFNKTSGEHLGELDIFPYDRNMSTSLRLHSSKLFSSKSNHNPCVKDNGRCENFCFAVPQLDKDRIALRKICKCFDGVKCKLTT